MRVNEVIEEMGTVDDFIAHASDDTFIIITKTKDVSGLVDQLRGRFNEDVQSHYNFIHREQGGIDQPDGTVAPLMRISIGVVSDKTHGSQGFSDIREITEEAAESRRRDQEEQEKLHNQA